MFGTTLRLAWLFKYVGLSETIDFMVIVNLDMKGTLVDRFRVFMLHKKTHYEWHPGVLAETLSRMA